MRKGVEKIKSGYIIVCVEGVDSFIINSHGFNFMQLEQIADQIQEPEEFEGVESGIYVFEANYCEPEKDQMGRITVEGYWELEQDQYCEAKQEMLRYELQQFMESLK